MPRARILITALILLGTSTSCKNARTSSPVAIRVLRDPSGGFAAELSRADSICANFAEFTQR
jgi:hypothetical protein